MMGLRWAGTLGITASLVVLAVPLRAQETVEGGELRIGAAEIELGGRVQTQFNTTTVDAEPETELILRRVRLEVEVRVNEWVSGKIQPEFAGEAVSLKDAYVVFDVAPGLGVLAGNAHKPFSLLEQTSSTRMPPVERGAEIRGITAWDEYSLVNGLDYSDRSVGVQVMGEPAGAPLGLAYAAGVFAGPLQGEIGERDTRQFAARATITPLEPITLGAGWSSREFAREVGEELFEVERGTAFEVDLEYGSFDPGFHLLGEIAWGDFDPFAEQEFLGAQAWLAYRTEPIGRLSTVEPTFRISYGEIDPAPVEGSGGVLYTPGLNLYLGGRNRVMVNYDVWRGDQPGADAESFKAMFQMVF